MVLLSQKIYDHLPDTIPCLPQNYNFEIKKTLKTILRNKAKKITLQFPDGLMKYSLAIIDTIYKYTAAECIILNDVVYGGCCIDDSFKSDLLIHYGHSCLIPINEMNVKVLYIFVDIKIDIEHLFNTIKVNFKEEKIAILGTIQFNYSINKLKKLLNNTKTPQIKPLSPGEVLGCTSPIIKDSKVVISIGDGRFHLESVMINNPTLDFYKYCPFSRKLTREYYDFMRMKKIRENEIQKVKNEFKSMNCCNDCKDDSKNGSIYNNIHNNITSKIKSFGLILGTLGKQGNKRILENIKKKLKGHNLYLFMLDEIEDDILKRYPFIDAFVQISCPRLSVDWGHSFSKPLLSPFEVFYEKGDQYVLDYYSREGEAPWR
ncbi:Diphthamide biosynthesis protein 1 [Nosema bombycis CQ1]|uniref:2-(3-amino-3-carboxypropyl)histidine synthase subunit 1 n=1 Tax=Nosema bombycis (strain CQ1 / CVCC 102059) TaxID=578461 RepID=R0MQK1_NOSB1|nr:Diphthamide biosynthesis protein 1 [Nosema bombycis CQ1]|eukprot:EOB15168.1 Diphthamide biosynthesis protein 1 [Nosema bombycis CQ1]